MGWRTEPIKAAIEQRAIAFVFPSNYEGFGIPIVEALSCGGIVITAHNSSLPEVGGDAALYIQQSSDTDALAQRMLECIEMPEQERARRIQLGAKQAMEFDWVCCAKETQKVIEAM